jgi:hypothetical protein
MTIENWLCEVEECEGRNATPIPNCLFTESRLSIGARLGVYIHLLKLVAQSPYWRSASVLMPLSQLSEECRLGVPVAAVSRRASRGRMARNTLSRLCVQ